MLLDSVDVGIVACDADGRLTLFNRQTREWQGGDIDAEPRARRLLDRLQPVPRRRGHARRARGGAAAARAVGGASTTPSSSSRPPTSRPPPSRAAAGRCTHRTARSPAPSSR
nr:hypothetical protein [Angustibacter aerolatus]